MTRTLVVLYDNFETARRAVEDLVDAGIDREKISIVSQDARGDYARAIQNCELEDVTGSEGAGFGAIVGALVGLGVAVIPGIGPALAAGPIASALLGGGVGAVAGAATGGITAALVDFGVSPDQSGIYAESIRRGNALVSATVDDNMEVKARDILNRHSPIDMDRRASFYREAGWSGYNAEAQPYTEEEIAADRQRFRDYSTDYTNRYQNVKQGTTDLDAEWENNYRSRFETDYKNNYATSGYTYNQFEPAYRYGYNLARHERYRDVSTWNDLEPEARRHWENTNKGTWDQFKDAVRRAWEDVKDTVA